MKSSTQPRKTAKVTGSYQLDGISTKQGQVFLLAASNHLDAIDSALLTDEIPLRAFTDKGFAAWLNRNSP